MIFVHYATNQYDIKFGLLNLTQVKQKDYDDIVQTFSQDF
jgi:hypothetical protein